MSQVRTRLGQITNVVLLLPVVTMPLLLWQLDCGVVSSEVCWVRRNRFFLWTTPPRHQFAAERMMRARGVRTVLGCMHLTTCT